MSVNYVLHNFRHRILYPRYNSLPRFFFLLVFLLLSCNFYICCMYSHFSVLCCYTPVLTSQYFLGDGTIILHLYLSCSAFSQDSLLSRHIFPIALSHVSLGLHLPFLGIILASHIALTCPAGSILHVCLNHINGFHAGGQFSRFTSIQ